MYYFVGCAVLFCMFVVFEYMNGGCRNFIVLLYHQENCEGPFYYASDPNVLYCVEDQSLFTCML